MQTLIMMSLVFSFSLRYTIQFRTEERGKALSSAVCQSLFFTTLVAELYLTVSPKAGGEKKNPSDKVDFWPEKINVFMKREVVSLVDVYYSTLH